MDTIFIDTENGKTSETHRFSLYFTDKLDLRRSKTIALANLSINYISENINFKYNTVNLKYQLQHGQKHLIYQMDQTKYQIFKTIF